MSKDTRTYECGPFIITAPARSCFFCGHCTDIFWDYSHGPYMLFCEDELDIDNGMRGTCSQFHEEDFEHDMQELGIEVPK